MHRQRPVAGQALERCHGDVGGEPSRAATSARGEPPRAAIGDLRRVGFEPADHAGRERRFDQVVGIEEQQPAAGRRRDAAVAGCRGALPFAEAGQQPDPRIVSADLPGHPGGAVGRTVVDDQRLPVAATLGAQAGERFGQGVGGVVRGDDDGEGHHGPAGADDPIGQALSARTDEPSVTLGMKERIRGGWSSFPGDAITRAVE